MFLFIFCFWFQPLVCTIPGNSRKATRQFFETCKRYCTTEMSAFWIFFACLTAAYAIYYTIIIGTDLMGKPKEQRQSSEESFVLDDSPEESRTVVETDAGFRVGDADAAELQDADREMMVSSPKDAQEKTFDEPSPDESGKNKRQIEEKVQSVQSGMEEIEPEQSTELVSDMLRSALLYGRPPVEIDKTVIPPTGEPSGEVDEKEVDDVTEMRI